MKPQYSQGQVAILIRKMMLLGTLSVLVGITFIQYALNAKDLMQAELIRAQFQFRKQLEFKLN